MLGVDDKPAGEQRRRRRIGMDRGGRLHAHSASSEFTASRYQHLGGEIITLINAVSICMFSAAALVRMFSYNRNPDHDVSHMRYLDEEEGVSVLFMKSFANAFSLLIIVMIANCVLVFLYKGGHYRIVKAWLMTGYALLLFVTGYYFLGRLLIFINTPMDHFSCALVTWNVGMAGIVALYFDAPCSVQQGYLVYASVLAAVVLEEAFPNWTSWIFLLLVCLWDVFAVLCALGPLRILLETAKEREEPLFPALVLSTSSAWCYEKPSVDVDAGSQEEASPIERSSEEPAARQINPRSRNTRQTSAEGTRVAVLSAVGCGSPSIPPELRTGTLQRIRASADEVFASANVLVLLAPFLSRGMNKASIEHQATCIGCTGDVGSHACASARDILPSPTFMPTSMTALLAVTICADQYRCGDGHGGSPSIGTPSPGHSGLRGYEQFSLTPSCNSEDSFGARAVPSGQRSQTARSPSPQARPKSGASSPRAPRRRSAEHRRWLNQEDALEHGLKLGLGDFIFYGMLLGKASRHGTLMAVVACYVSVLVGALLTVTLLVVFRKPLPALPFSVLLGLGAYFASAIFLDPFLEAADFLAY